MLAASKMSQESTAELKERLLSIILKIQKVAESINGNIKNTNILDSKFGEDKLLGFLREICTKLIEQEL